MHGRWYEVAEKECRAMLSMGVRRVSDLSDRTGKTQGAPWLLRSSKNQEASSAAERYTCLDE